MTPEIKSFILELYTIGVVQFGSFTLKSGIQSPIYIDMRLIISYPHLMKKLSAILLQKIKPLPCDLLCGVPYAALPFATALSLQADLPLIMCRKEVKEYGTKKPIEGKFEKGQRCLLIEDVVTSGGSILETAQLLKNQGLEIEDAIVLLDREQGGSENLKIQGIHLHPLISIFDLLKVLFNEKKIAEPLFKEVNELLATHRK